jgi:hypothetical protein
VLSVIALCALCVVYADAAGYAAPGDNYGTGVGSNGVTFVGFVPDSTDAALAGETIAAGGATVTVGTCGSITAPSSSAWYVLYDGGCDTGGVFATLWQTGMNTTVPDPGTASPSPSPSPSTSTAAVVQLDGDSDFVGFVEAALALIVFFSAATFVMGWKR